MPDPSILLPQLGITISILWAAYEDVTTYSVPRYIWIPAALTVPMAIYHMIDGIGCGPDLQLLLPFLYVGAAGLAYVAGINLGDIIGMALVFLNLGYGLTGLLLLMWLGICMAIALALILMIRTMTHQQVPKKIPFLVPVAAAVLLTIFL